MWPDAVPEAGTLPDGRVRDSDDEAQDALFEPRRGVADSRRGVPGELEAQRTRIRHQFDLFHMPPEDRAVAGPAPEQVARDAADASAVAHCGWGILSRVPGPRAVQELSRSGQGQSVQPLDGRPAVRSVAA